MVGFSVAPELYIVECISVYRFQCSRIASCAIEVLVPHMQSPEFLESKATFLSFLLGGSWVVISRVRSPTIWVIIIVTLLTTPLIATHEPPSRSCLVIRGHPKLLNPKPIDPKLSNPANLKP